MVTAHGLSHGEIAKHLHSALLPPPRTRMMDAKFLPLMRSNILLIASLSRFTPVSGHHCAPHSTAGAPRLPSTPLALLMKRGHQSLLHHSSHTILQGMCIPAVHAERQILPCTSSSVSVAKGHHLFDLNDQRMLVAQSSESALH